MNAHRNGNIRIHPRTSPRRGAALILALLLLVVLSLMIPAILRAVLLERAAIRAEDDRQRLRWLALSALRQAETDPREPITRVLPPEQSGLPRLGPLALVVERRRYPAGDRWIATITPANPDSDSESDSDSDPEPRSAPPKPLLRIERLRPDPAPEPEPEPDPKPAPSPEENPS